MSDVSGFGPPSGPPAGWYPDPYNPSQQRYWDGRAWDLSTPAFGFSPIGTDDYPDIGGWLDVSFRSAYQRWRAVSAIALITAPITTAASYLAIARLAEGVVITDESVDGWTSDRLPVVIALFVVGMLTSVIGGLALARLLLDTVDGEQAGSTGEEIRSGLRALARGLAIAPRTIGWFLVLVLGLTGVVLVAAALITAIPALAPVLFLAAIPLAAWIGVKWAFLLVAIVDAPGAPFGRSSRVSQGRWWSTFGRLLLLGIIMWLISLVIQTAGTITTGGGFGGFGSSTTTIEIGNDGSFDPIVLDDELDFGWWFIVVTSITSILGTILASSVTAAAMSVLYRTRQRTTT